jgi:hypothetical protein
MVQLAVLVSCSTLTMIAGCSKKSDNTAETAAAASDAGEAKAAEAPAAAAPKPPPSKASFRGSYTSTANKLYVPSGTDVPNAKEWDNVKWRGDETEDALGEGKLSLVLDAATGSVTGDVEGPLGPATVRGRIDGDVITATVTPVTTDPPAPYGTLRATRTGDAIDGEMKVAMSLGNVLRAATFRIARSAD